jgi:hypothetical protein
MAIEIRDFTVTIPAGTAISAHFAASLAIPPRVVTQINVRVPPGPRGEVGFSIASGGVNIIPVTSGDFIVTDNEDLIYPLEDTITSGAWQLLGYNTGSFDHTLRVYLFCDLVPLATGGASVGTSGSGVVGTTGTTDGSGGGTTTPTPTPTPVPVPTPTPTPTPVPPPTIANPVLLPPQFNIPVSLGGPVLPANPEEVLIGVADLAEVWFLTEDAYRPVTSQDDVNTLVNMGIQGVAVSSALHTAILAASSPDTSVVIGPEVLSGWWQAVQRGRVLGVA